MNSGPQNPSEESKPHQGNVEFFPGGGTVGFYQMTTPSARHGTIYFASAKKPSLFHRMCVRIFLGWIWIDRITPGSGSSDPTICDIPIKDLIKK